MNRKQIMLLVFGLAVAAASLTYLVAKYQAGPSELEIIRWLVEASIDKQEVIDKNKLKQTMARGRARRVCAQAVELWAAYAHRCSREDAAGRETLRAAVREMANRTLKCHRTWQVGTGEVVNRCFAFLMAGSCEVLSYKLQDLPLSSTSAAAGGAGKPRPHWVCLGVF